MKRNPAPAGDRVEARRRELAAFLRARRESLGPESAGLVSYGRRRTPGLRREEVAMLAQIGTGWYTKLEMARNVKVSPNTLLSITRVLRLNRTETEYVFALADVAMPIVRDESEDRSVPPLIDHLVPRIAESGAVLWDRYMTAIRWNAIADAMFDFAQYPNPIDRNAIVRLHRDDFRVPYYGADYAELVRSLVGIFRRSYVSEDPTDLAREVYDIANNYELFRKIWNERPVEEALFQEGRQPLERHHNVVGTYFVIATNLHIVGRTDLYLRVWGPADDASAEKFEQLASLGTAWHPRLHP